ncbi:MAG: helix-turn-helix transcriptional regulator [Gemmatimonadaceae bacterium]
MPDLNPGSAVNTRDRVLALLRQGPQTVDSLSRALALSANAVRLHLASLQRDGLAHVSGMRREGPGKPAAIYEVPTDVDLLLSRVHAPLLLAVLDELRERVSTREFTSLLRAAGRRAAADSPRAGGSLADRASATGRWLESLGAQVRTRSIPGGVAIESDGCVVGSVVARHPQACAAIAALVGEVTGADATVACDRAGAPHCRFHLSG